MKKFTLSIQEGLYEKLKTYAKENGISMLGAIRYILNQFFKQNTK